MFKSEEGDPAKQKANMPSREKSKAKQTVGEEGLHECIADSLSTKHERLPPTLPRAPSANRTPERSKKETKKVKNSTLANSPGCCEVPLPTIPAASSVTVTRGALPVSGPVPLFSPSLSFVADEGGSVCRGTRFLSLSPYFCMPCEDPFCRQSLCVALTGYPFSRYRHYRTDYICAQVR